MEDQSKFAVYSGVMGQVLRRCLLLCLIAASLTGALRAQEYTVRVPRAVAPARIELLAQPSGIGVLDWDITVGFDAARCEIFCTYRPKRDAFGLPRPAHFLPPVAVIQLYPVSGEAPQIVSIDPAGLRFPGATSELRFDPNPASGPEKRFQTEAPARAGAIAQSATRQTVASPANSRAFALSSAPLPLRI